MQLNWSYGEIGKFDWVGLFRGKPTNPKNFLCGAKSWAWAIGKSSFQTDWHWAGARDLWVAYVAQDSLTGQGKIVATAGPLTRIGAPAVSLSWAPIWPYPLRLNYGNARPGTRDWVAIYNKDPSLPGAVRLYSSFVSGTNFIQTVIPWARGYYGAALRAGLSDFDPASRCEMGPAQVSANEPGS